MKNLFVGNLDYQTTQDELTNLFATYGTVERVSVMRDRDTGQPRGFAFVEMSVNSEAESAIQALNGYLLHNRAMNVNEARPKPESGPRGGFGGGAGGRNGQKSGGGGGGFNRQRREPRW